jgi:hypothetical protein
LSTPLFGITAINETEKTVTCFIGKKNIGMPDVIQKDKKWKKNCDFMKNPTCQYFCTYQNQIEGSALIISILEQNDNYKMVKGKNRPVFQRIK